MVLVKRKGDVHMARSNKRLEQAFERINRGTPASNPYEVTQDVSSTKLIHYGTVILEVDTKLNSVIDFNPYSMTSIQAINSSLDILGIYNRKISRKKLVRM